MRNLLLVALVVGLIGCSDDGRNNPAPPTIEPVPVRQVSLSFDDGISSDSIAKYLWLFDRYDAKMTYYLSSPWHFDKDTVLRIQDAGHEIGHHTLSHKSAPAYVAEYGIDTWLEDEIYKFRDTMNSYGIYPTTFAYPYGSGTPETDEALRGVFEHIRYFTSGEDMLPSGGYAIKAYSIDAKYIDMMKIYDAMDAIKDGETLYLTSHVIGEWVNEWHITADDLEAILSYGHSTNITFCSVRDC